MLTRIATEREEKSARRNRSGRGKGQETRLLTVPKPIEGIFLPLLRVKWEAGAILCLFAVDLDRREASMWKLLWEKKAKMGMVNERKMGFYKYTSGIGSVALSLQAVTSSASPPLQGSSSARFPRPRLPSIITTPAQSRVCPHGSAMHYVTVTYVTNASFTSKR